MTEAGPLELIDEDEDNVEDIALPGVLKGKALVYFLKQTGILWLVIDVVTLCSFR